MAMIRERIGDTDVLIQTEQHQLLANFTDSFLWNG